MRTEIGVGQLRGQMRGQLRGQLTGQIEHCLLFPVGFPASVANW